MPPVDETLKASKLKQKGRREVENIGAILLRKIDEFDFEQKYAEN